MKVVSNTTPIISLASIGKLDILKELFNEIIIAETVYNEIKAKKSYGYEEVELEYITVKAIQGKIYQDLLLNQLDLGEAETILLAKEINADFAIIDENLGYKIAKNAGLNVVRTLSILLKAKQKGIIKEIKPLLDDMISKGRWYSKTVYKDFLERVGELG
jgi:predicted nucleic acid-binding protein